MQAQIKQSAQNVSNVVFYIDLEKYEEIKIKGREWWEQVPRKDRTKLERTPANEIIIIKKADKDSVEEKEEIIYSDWGIPLEKYVYKIIQTTKRYIVFYDLDDAVNLRIENAEFVDELPEDVEAIEIPLTVDSFGFHHVIDAIDFTWNLNRR